MAAHQHWGVVGMVAAAGQQGFCWAMLSGCQCWHVGGAVALSWRLCRRAGVKGEGPDNQLEGREEGGGVRGEGDTQHDVLVGMAAAAQQRGF